MVYSVGTYDTESDLGRLHLYSQAGPAWPRGARGAAGGGARGAARAGRDDDSIPLGRPEGADHAVRGAFPYHP